MIVSIGRMPVRSGVANISLRVAAITRVNTSPAGMCIAGTISAPIAITTGEDAGCAIETRRFVAMPRRSIGAKMPAVLITAPGMGAAGRRAILRLTGLTGVTGDRLQVVLPKTEKAVPPFVFVEEGARKEITRLKT